MYYKLVPTKFSLLIHFNYNTISDTLVLTNLYYL